MTMRLPPALIALTPGDLDEARARDFPRVVDRCVRSGLRGMLLREPLLSDRATLDLGRELRRVLGDGWLGVHDRVHLAQACSADAVHVGFRSLDPQSARSILPESVALGASAHEGDDAHRWSVCDYVFFGPVLDTPSKRGLRSPVGFDGLARAAASTRVPVWAIGGLLPDHAASVIAAGAAGAAVLRGISCASDPGAACARYLEDLHAALRS